MQQKGLPESQNVEDRRNESYPYFRVALDYMTGGPHDYSWEEYAKMLRHPFTPINETLGEPLLPQGPLARTAGYDDIDKAIQQDKSLGYWLDPLDKLPKPRP